MTSETNGAGEALRSPQRLYARIWRWHFFAALLVIPFVLWQSVTGTLYLWHEEIADWIHQDLRFTRPLPTRVTYDEQLATALARHPGERLAFMRISENPRRTTMFSFSARNDLAHPAFVDPYTGEYLGAVAPTTWLPGLTRSLHGGWPINPYGSYLLELGASWAIVMVLTGLFLWWPRNAVGFGGVFYPRLRAGSRTFWRDLHSVVGVYFALIFLVFLFTALPWTAFWGDQILKPIQRMSGQVAPTAAFFGGRGSEAGCRSCGASDAPTPTLPRGTGGGDRGGVYIGNRSWKVTRRLLLLPPPFHGGGQGGGVLVSTNSSKSHARMVREARSKCGRSPALRPSTRARRWIGRPRRCTSRSVLPARCWRK